MMDKFDVALTAVTKQRKSKPAIYISYLSKTIELEQKAIKNAIFQVNHEELRDLKLTSSFQQQSKVTLMQFPLSCIPEDFNRTLESQREEIISLQKIISLLTNK